MFIYTENKKTVVLVVLAAVASLLTPFAALSGEEDEAAGLPVWLVWTQADSDGDGVKNVDDAFPQNPVETDDTDGDGIGNNADQDDDGDGVADDVDLFPLDPSESIDSDGDGIGNNADTDDDNDGAPDTDDSFPFDSEESLDTDNDGIGNNADADDDGDGVLDDDDAFPLDASETVDTDSDGIGNNADEDDDGDGSSDAEDRFPLDPTESSDADNDGIGNNADPDDDNDEMPDVWEQRYGLDPLSDTDREQDLDNDQVSNINEYLAGGNPAFEDSDYDTLRDGYEVALSTDMTQPRYVLAARTLHACVMSDDVVECWGNEGDGRASPPVDLVAPTTIGVGKQHSCVIDEGKVRCWGANFSGEQNVTEMNSVDLLAVGEQSVCAHSSQADQIECWGWNGNGETDAPTLNNPSQLSAGAQHYCALDDEGVKCWGWGGNGETSVPELTGPSFVEAGRFSSCAIDQGAIVCWGFQSWYLTPPAMNKPFDIAVGSRHSCALDFDGIQCWALSPTGSDAAKVIVPEEVVDPVQIEAGDNYTCALHSAGVSCWGDLPESSLVPPESLLFDADEDSYSIQNGQDVFPEDSTEWGDRDSDGIGDNADDDNDNDGVIDDEDAFWLDPAASVDTDDDGYPDEWNANANEEQITASDLQIDEMPNDPTEYLDTDGDGIGNNADPDDDGDGANDEDDVDPLDPSIIGFFVTGTVSVTGDAVLDSDTNNPNNEFQRNNVEGENYPIESAAQAIESISTMVGYAHRAGSGPVGVTFEEGDRSDIFIVDAVKGQRFTLTIGDPIRGDLDLYLWNESIDTVASSLSGSSAAEVVVAPEDGRYFLHVYAWSGASVYEITADFDGEVTSPAELKIGEAIVTLKSGGSMTTSQRVAAFGGIASQFDLKALTQSMGVTGLLKAQDVVAQMKLTGDFPMLDAYATQEGRERAATELMIKQIASYPGVAAAQPNYIYRSHATTNDPRLEEMWQLDLINVPAAWDTTTGDPNVVIAIVDTGNLSQHPDLIGKSTAGYDFISSSGNSDGDGIDADPEDSMPLTDTCSGGSTFYHGAHVAGTAAATGDNEEGIVGVSYTAELMHIRVLDGRCGGSTYDVAQGVLYAIGAENDSGEVPERPADVVNMSLGGGGYDAYFESVLQDAEARGVIVAASSGNDGASSVGFPARYDTTIAVGSVGFDGEVTSYSNRGENLDLVAPGGGNGAGILSLHKSEEGFTYTEGNGTSMATPHAAGIFALMKGLHPDITPERVRSFIEAGVITQEMGNEGFDTLSGYGLLDAEKAINVALDDAAGTFRFPARFVLSDDELYFTEVMTAELVITNTGEIPADVSEVTSSETWVTLERLDEQEDDAVGRWSIAVNGEGLEAGFYSSDVRFVGVDEEGTEVVTTFKARLRIGKDGVGDVGVISVVLLSADSLAEVNSTITTAADGYSYRLGVPEAGTYKIAAGGDIDFNGEVCTAGEACGYVLDGSEDTLTLEAASSGLDIIVRLNSDEQ